VARDDDRELRDLAAKLQQQPVTPVGVAGRHARQG